MSRRQSGRALPVLLVVLAVVVLAAAGLATFRVGGPPQVTIEPALPGIGRSTPVEITISEDGRGLASLRVEVVQGERSEVVAEKKWTPRPAWAFWGARTTADTLTVPVGKETLSWLKPGKAVVRASAGRAGTWLRSPDSVATEIELPVRLTPPSISPISTAVYVRQGGSEVVVYRVGDTAVRHGVEAGEWFFPGFPLPGGRPGDQFAFFSVPWDMDSDANVRLLAEDDVGNTARASFIDRFFPKPPSRDTIRLTDAFMEKVVPEILSQTPELEDGGSLLDNYLEINRELRRKNNAFLVELASRSRPEFLWSRPFEQMANTQVMASFADRRTYLYDGQVVDHQTHLGLDLAATRAATVPASNDGIVVLARYFGIYGNTVVLDHGYGLMSLYGHLSAIDVQEGQPVRRGEPIGLSGATGLAGGDHLHFTLLLQGLPVTPIEWWDAHWIEDRIARKLGPGFRFEP